MLESRDIVKLDNNVDYIVVSKVEYEGKIYYYLLEINGTNVLICYERNDELVDVKDKELCGTLIDMFAKQELSTISPEEKERVEGYLKEINNAQ